MIRTIAAQNVGVMASPSVKCAQMVVVSGMKLLNNITWLVRQWRSAEFQSAYGTTPPNRMQNACTPRCGASITRPWAATSTNPSGSSQTPDIHMECAATSTPVMCWRKNRHLPAIIGPEQAGSQAEQFAEQAGIAGVQCRPEQDQHAGHGQQRRAHNAAALDRFRRGRSSASSAQMGDAPRYSATCDAAVSRNAQQNATI